MKRDRYLPAAGCLVLLVALVSWLQPLIPVDDPVWRRGHDVQLKKHAKHYFGVYTDWRWFRAQGIVESGLRSNARSGRGAQGVMQIIPSTFEEIWKVHSRVPDIYEPRWNVASGIAYDRYLYERWAHRVPRSERFSFMLASYNAGYAGVSRAVKRARQAGAAVDGWDQVARYAPEETRHYVTRIRELMGESG